MTQPQPPEDNITAEQGFARLKAVLAVWVPARLYHTGRIRKGFRSLKRGG